MGEKSKHGRRRETVRRISISLPESLYYQLDRLVDQRGFHNRSQAVGEMIASNLAEHHESQGSMVMAASLTLFYDISGGKIRQELARLQQRYIGEVVSSLHVLLENHHVIEVIMLQGPASELESIADAFITLKGVRTGKLTLVSQIRPPPQPSNTLPPSQAELLRAEADATLKGQTPAAHLPQIHSTRKTTR